MFHVGDYIVYGCKGVCLVKDITTLKMDGIPKDRLYYELQPCFQEGSRIYTPVEPGNGKNVMRPMLTREEATKLLDQLPDAQEEWIKDDRMREASYKEMINNCNADKMLRTIKMLHLRRKERAASGRKLAVIDSKYLHFAEENLFAELSICLDEPREKVEDYLEEKIGMLEGTMRNA